MMDHETPLIVTGTVVDTGEVVYNMQAPVVCGTDLDEARELFISGSKWMPQPRRGPYDPL